MLKRKPYCLVLYLAVFCIVPAKAGPPGAAVPSWHYDSTTKVLTARVVNTSSRDISGYCLSITVKFMDGTQSTSEMSNDYLPRMASVRVSPALQQRYGSGSFTPGASYDETVLNSSPKDVSDVLATVDVVVYADGTSDVQNRDAFKHLMAHRQAELLAFKQANEVVKQSSDSKAASKEIGGLADAAKTKKGGPLDDPQSHLEIALRILSSRAQGTDLNQFAQDLQTRIAFYPAHIQLKEIQQ